MNAPPRTLQEQLLARLAALESRPDPTGPLAELHARTRKLEDTLPEDQLVENAQQIGAGGVESTAATKAEVRAIEAGPWTAVVLGPKIEARPGIQAPEVRTELHAASARVRGGFQAKAAENLAIGETLFTLPVGFRPPALIEITQTSTAGVVLIVKIAATGVVTLSKELKAGEAVLFDGETFNLT
jgi:hypothetical protein